MNPLRALLALWVWLILSPIASAGPYRVIVDPGHGGSDSGAVHCGVREADVSLAVSKLLARRLNRDSHFKALLTRRSDKKLTLKQRRLFAERMHGDLFISIHANSSPDTYARGAEFYFQNQLPPSEEALFLVAREDEVDHSNHLRHNVFEKANADVENPDILAIIDDLLRNHRIFESDRFARDLLSNWHETTHRRKYAIKQAPFYLVSRLTIPSTLVELGYLTHRSEARRLNDPKVQKNMARDLYAGIVKFKDSLDKTR